MSRFERGFWDVLSASHSFGNCIPFRMRIPGCSFRLRRHPETAPQSEPEFRDGFSAWGDVDAGHGRLQSDRHRICIGLKLCAENPRICFANPHRLRPAAAVLARGLKTLTRFLNARALHRVRFSAVSLDHKKAGRYESLTACNCWWRRGESNSGPRKPPDWHLQAQSLV